jgi:Na+/proline symporter
MLTTIDYCVLGFYFVFMAALGLVFRRFSKDIADYFQGGGKMLWWMTGASALMGSISAWSLTGAASLIYESGTLVLMLYGSNLVALAIVYAFTCYRFRQMRVITYGDAIRRRFGPATEQFYVWLQVPVSLVLSSFTLYALGIFLAAVFQTDVGFTIVVVGSVVVTLAVLGGAWSVAAGDFLQMLMMFVVLGMTTFFVLSMPGIGGLSGLLSKLPDRHWDWTATFDPKVLWVWCPMMFLNQLTAFNNMAEGSAKFLFVKDGRHARFAAAMMFGCLLVFVVLLMIPPMAAAVVLPNLGAVYPRLANPSEAAYVAISVQVLPPGMIGLLIAGILSVAMANMDTGLNRNAGLFARNVYHRWIRPQANPRQLLIAGKLCTLAFGLIIIMGAGVFAMSRAMDLFSMMLAIATLIGLPLSVPVVFGLVIWRSPAWASWSSTLLGAVAAWFVRFGVKADGLARIFALDTFTYARESEALTVGVTGLAVYLVGGGWFLAATWLHRRRGGQMSPEAAALIADMNRPIDSVRENIVYDDQRQYRVMGVLCMAYGTGVMLFSLLPNQAAGRWAFIICGGIIAAIGAALWRLRRKTAGLLSGDTASASGAAKPTS